MRTSERQGDVTLAAPSDAPSLVRKPAMRRSRRLMWTLLAIALIGLPLLSLPGHYVNDTRDALWLSPGAYMSKVAALWRNSPYMGFEQHDGIAFPMGVVVWLLHATGLPVWVVERLWHGLLLFTAAATTIVLVDHVKGKRTIVAPILAGLTYALTPFAFGYGLPYTGTFLAYCLLPLLLVVTLRGVGQRGLLWPALFGLTTALMGGGNGAPQIYAVLTALLLMAWIAWIDRGVAPARVLGFGALSLGFAIALNAYWLALLGSAEIHNALLFSEQPRVINVASSTAETIRGLGFWMFYGGDQYGPWAPAVRPYVTTPLLLLTGFAVPIAAVASAWLVRWRFRLFFLSLAILAVFVGAGTFPVTASTPFGHVLLWAYAHIPGASGLRTTYKFLASLNLSFAVLIGMGVDPALGWLSRLRRSTLIRAACGASAFAIVAANAFPIWTGHLYPSQRGMISVPAYWQQALDDLQRSTATSRAFFAPATIRATYKWGLLKEGITSAAPNLPAIYPLRLPVGERYGSNLLTAVEQPYFSAVGEAGVAQMFRYLGIKEVVLQNDLDWERSHTARPSLTYRLLQAPGMTLARSYGRPGQGFTSPPLGPDYFRPFQRFEARLPPVQILSVTDPLPVIRAEGPSPVILAGDGFGIDAAAGAGLLATGQPVLYSGSLSPSALTQVLARSTPSVVITDSQRRRVWLFTTPRARYSYTLPAGQTLNDRVTGWGLFGGRQDTQSVATYPQLSSITMSNDGSPAFIDPPQFQPANAFDGNPNTWWMTGFGGDPIGGWVQATFRRPTIVGQVAVTIPPPADARPIERIRLEFSAGPAVEQPVRSGATTVIRFPAHTTTFLRARIVGAAPQIGGRSAVAIADMGIPGLATTELIRTPTDLFDTAAQSSGGLGTLSTLDFTYLFERARTGFPSDRDEEVGIARRFQVTGARSLVLQGTAHLDMTAPDAAIDQLAFGRQSVTVYASTRLGQLPQFRGSAAFDGNPVSEWVPRGAVGQSLAIRFPPHRIGGITVATAVGSGRTPVQDLRVTFSDGSSVVGHVADPTGAIPISFRPRVTSSITLTVASVITGTAPVRNPIGIREVHIPGVAPLSTPASTALPCYIGSGFMVDGRPLSVQLDGTAGDLLAGRELSLHTCSGQQVGVASGTHDLIAQGVIQPDTITLSSRSATSGAPNELVPTVTSSTPIDGSSRVAVTNATGPYYLVIGQNYNERWRASIDGKSLGPPLLLDGYSAGWYVDRRGTYTIAVWYGSQSLYTVALLMSGAGLALTILVCGWRVIRRRRAVA